MFFSCQQVCTIKILVVLEFKFIFLHLSVTSCLLVLRFLLNFMILELKIMCHGVMLH